MIDSHSSFGHLVPPVDEDYLGPGEDFRDVVIPFDSPRLVNSRGLDLDTYSNQIIGTERATGLLAEWRALLEEPYRGITADGQHRDGLFEVADEGFDPGPAVAAARELIDGASDSERDSMLLPLEAKEWRDWYNPEWLVNHHGLRVDQASEATQENVAQLLRACFSADGYLKTERVRSANLYLGELYDLRQVMNEWSYHFMLFGTPSATEPWGWNLYGHHLALNCLILGHQVVVSPTFMGAEPTIIDRGPNNRFRLFEYEAAHGLALHRSLSPELRQRAVIYEQMHDPAMPPGRWNFADERHLGGAYRDNRVIPYEGVRASELASAQRNAILEIADDFVSYLPDAVREARLRQIGAHLKDTWWSWIGGSDDDAPFYYRIQSPVIMLEFDNHTGVWLTNTEPARYHVHTIVRTPNGNDYGRDLLRQHYEETHGSKRRDEEARVSDHGDADGG